MALMHERAAATAAAAAISEDMGAGTCLAYVGPPPRG